jgi:outer membrane protein TolC
MKALFSTLLVSLFLSVASPAARAEAPTAKGITLEEFLSQVRKQHGGVQAAINSSEGALERSREADLITGPGFFASAGRSIDYKPNPFMSYNKLSNDSYTFGFSQQTSFGLQGKLSYNLMKSDYNGLPAGFGPNPPTYFEGRPQIEATQSLWRNGFGSEVRAMREAAEASAKATHFSESYRLKGILAEAELSYWRLALAREKVAIGREAFARSQKLYDWSARRAKLQLADQADALQAEGALSARELELQSWLDEERVAARGFNLARGVSSDEMNEKLAFVDTLVLGQIPAPQRDEFRDDVQAAREGERATRANAELAIEKVRPSLDLFGTYAFNSKNATAGKAIGESFKDDRPSVIFGVKFTAPLDLGAVASAKSGWAKEKSAAELLYQRKLLEQDSEWSDLSQRLIEGKKRLELALKMEGVQKRKLTHERDRLTRGRTTTFQVLQFEQDFSQAQLTRIMVEVDIVNILVRMKTFRSQT